VDIPSAQPGQRGDSAADDDGGCGLIHTHTQLNLLPRAPWDGPVDRFDHFYFSPLPPPPSILSRIKFAAAASGYPRADELERDGGAGTSANASFVATANFPV